MGTDKEINHYFNLGTGLYNMSPLQKPDYVISNVT